MKCCTQAKLALPAGGVPYFQRSSSRRRSPPQSLMLNGGLARTKSAFRSGCRSLWKLSACSGPRLASMPRMARFILREPPGRGVGLLAVDGDVVHAGRRGPRRTSRTETNMPPEPQQGSKTRPLVRLEHLDQELDDALRRVELAAASCPPPLANLPRKYS